MVFDEYFPENLDARNQGIFTSQHYVNKAYVFFVNMRLELNKITLLFIQGSHLNDLPVLEMSGNTLLSRCTKINSEKYIDCKNVCYQELKARDPIRGDVLNSLHSL